MNNVWTERADDAVRAFFGGADDAVPAGRQGRGRAEEGGGLRRHHQVSWKIIIIIIICYRKYCFEETLFSLKGFLTHMRFCKQVY